MKEINFKFEDLKVYQKALNFVDLAYETCGEFPVTERYGISSQFTRAAVSIALNIAEGSLAKMITGLQKYLKSKN